MGFIALNMIICFSNLLYTPILCHLRKAYAYEQLDAAQKPNEMTSLNAPKQNGSSYPTSVVNNTAFDGNAVTNDDAYGYQSAGGAAGAGGGGPALSYDPLNPQW